MLVKPLLDAKLVTSLNLSRISIKWALLFKPINPSEVKNGSNRLQC